MPIARITQMAPVVTPTTPIQIFFGASSAANLAVINGDLMTGGELSYVNLNPIYFNAANLYIKNRIESDSAYSTCTYQSTPSGEQVKMQSVLVGGLL